MGWLVATFMAAGAGIIGLLLTRVERVRISEPATDETSATSVASSRGPQHA